MNKKYIFGIILIIAIIAGIVAFIYNYTKSNFQKEGDSNYNSTRTSQNITNNTDENTDSLEDSNTETENSTSTEENTENSAEENTKTSTEEAKNSVETSKETEIASFTTKIYTKDPDRQNNVTIACSTLNDTIVENDSTFSFSNTVGKATSAKGYKKADVFKDGEVIEALGGGLCQVSTTLYNAVLKVPDTTVTERHSHSNKVPYIQSGKDAAVSYGAYDFKFVNNTGNSLKIKAENTPNNVAIKILKLE